VSSVNQDHVENGGIDELTSRLKSQEAKAQGH
jgi:hypothetical protein